jgi:DNA-binding SARP family transcriptional activator
LLQLGYDAFLLSLAKEMQPLLAYAVEQGVGGQLLAHLLDKASRANQPHPGSEQIELAEPVPPLHLYGLGRAHVVVGERPLSYGDWRTITARDLLFYLLCEGPAGRDELARVFWPALSPGKLRSALHTTCYRLRRALAPLPALTFEDEVYGFNHALDYVFDVEVFERLLAQAGALAAEPSQAIELYTRAVELYQGDFLDDYASAHDEWRVVRASALSEKYLGAAECLGGLLSRQHEYAAALDAYRRAVICDAYREPARRGVMRCLARLGRRAEALRYYREWEAFVQAELGALPMPETERLYQCILDNQPLADAGAGGERSDHGDSKDSAAEAPFC